VRAVRPRLHVYGTKHTRQTAYRSTAKTAVEEALWPHSPPAELHSLLNGQWCGLTLIATPRRDRQANNGQRTHAAEQIAKRENDDECHRGFSLGMLRVTHIASEGERPETHAQHTWRGLPTEHEAHY
jgi:hypothetical protein